MDAAYFYVLIHKTFVFAAFEWIIAFCYVSVALLCPVLSRNSTASPNKHFKSKIGFPHEYKPNIHELKQLFDDTKRSHISSYANVSEQQQIQKPSQKSHQRTYSDAKPTLIDPDLNSFDLRMQSRNNAFNFERAKQKFDNSGRPTSNLQQKQPIYSVSQKQSSSFIPKRNTSYHENNHQASNDDPFVTSPIYADENLSKGNYSMTSSINLDGLKVSDDEWKFRHWMNSWFQKKH